MNDENKEIPQPEEQEDKVKDFKGTIKKLVRYIGGYRAGIIAVALFTVGGTVFSVIGPKVLGSATTELAEGLVRKLQQTGEINIKKIGEILVMVMLVFFISATFRFLQNLVMSEITQRFCYRLRKDISEKLNRLPLKYFESRNYGEILSRITNDVDTMGEGISQSVTELISAFTTAVGVFIMMLYISPLMTGIAVLTLPLSLLCVGIVVGKSQKYFEMQQEYLGHINSQVEENYAGHDIVKAFNNEEMVVDTFRKTNEILYESSWKSQFLSGIMSPLMLFVGNLGYVGVVIAGAFLVVKGSIKVGDIQAFAQYVRNFSAPIQSLAQIASVMQSTVAAAERVFEVLDEREEEDVDSEFSQDGVQAEEKGIFNKMVETTDKDLQPDKVQGNVEFRNVRFGYNEDRIVISNFSAKIKSGEQVAIVGPTGAGKTTMIKLLMRFYDVNEGQILVDDQDVRLLDRSQLRESFGMVLQDTWLFKGTIMENIRYGKPDATDEEVIAAAKAAYAHHFIETLPRGYHMEIDEEAGNVSGGQKQLLTIARAILANRPILILDEATSSVDTRTEHRIQKAMSNLMMGRTSFVIAHRLSTIKNADLILVMKDGDIIEQGKHEDLMAKNGFYAELYNSQWIQSETA